MFEIKSPCDKKKCCKGYAFAAFLISSLFWITIIVNQIYMYAQWGLRNDLASYNPRTGHLEWRNNK